MMGVQDAVQGPAQGLLFEAPEPAGASVGTSECGICGRPLTNPTSVAVGIGPVCRGWRTLAHVSTIQGCDRMTDFTDGYIGQPMHEGIVLERDEAGRVFTNVPHFAVDHSPSGYEFGYAGSGPADLALNICEALVRDLGIGGRRIRVYDGEVFAEAQRIHQDFKFRYIAGVAREGATIDYNEAASWVQARITELREAEDPMLALLEIEGEEERDGR